MLRLSKVFPGSARNASLSVLYTASAPEEAKGKQRGLMVLSTPLGSLLEQPHKLVSLPALRFIPSVYYTCPSFAEIICTLLVH